MSLVTRHPHPRGVKHVDGVDVGVPLQPQQVAVGPVEQLGDGRAGEHASEQMQVVVQRERVEDKRAAVPGGDLRRDPNNEHEWIKNAYLCTGPRQADSTATAAL